MLKYFALSAALFMGALANAPTARAQGNKVLWCHYPPGQWTGDPTTSKVLILSIDAAAEPGHLGHSPLLSDGRKAEGITSDGTTAGCPIANPPTTNPPPSGGPQTQ
jgi:hypothetical protein